MNSTHDLIRGLARRQCAAPDKLAEPRARLAAAQSDGILDVAYRVAGSPVGDLLVAADGLTGATTSLNREKHSRWPARGPH